MGLLQTRLDWDELNDNAYNGGKRLLQDLGKAAKGVACQLYRDTPGALIPNPASNFLAGMWDGICSDDPQGLPPPPAPPFEGGQCCDSSYRVDVAAEYFRCSGVKHGSFSKPVYPPAGKIIGFISKFQRPGYTGFYIISEDCSGGRTETKAEETNLNYSESCSSSSQTIYDKATENLQIVNIVLRSGSNACGNPPPKYTPPPSNYTPPSGDITIPTRPDGSGIDLTIPFAWIDADFNLDIKPYIDVGGIKITFDIGGINFEFNSDNPPPTYNPDINPLPDTIFPPPPPPFPDIPDYTDDFNDLIDLNNNNKIDLTNVVNNVGNDIKTDIQTETNEIDADLQAILDLLNNLTNNPPPPPPPSTVEITYNRGSCGENGWNASTSTLIVSEDLADSVRTTLNEIDATKRQICEKDIGEIVGIPLNHYDGTTSACVVLYFAVTIPGAKGIGRYLQIPNPNIEAIVSACPTIPPYQTGDFMAYVQFNSSKGEKIQVNGITPEYATAMKNLLRGLSLYTDEDVYYDAPARRTPSKYKRSLELRRATYFFNRKSRYDGSDRGRIIWEKSYAN